MNTFKKITIALALFIALAFAPQATAQASFGSTTLGAAITSTNCSQQTVALASTSTMGGLGTQGNPTTVLYVDKEYMWVNSVTDSTHVVVNRCRGTQGVSARPVAHANGATVWFANVSGANAAASYFRNTQPTGEDWGACTAANELILPKVYLFSGDVFNCFGGQWVLVGQGTMATNGTRISAFCTGNLGSAETEYLNGAACSGATTATAGQVISTPGTLANLYVNAGTAVTGGTNKDVLTVYKNGSSTTLTCTFATGGAATTCSDTTHGVSVAVGDVITFQFVTATSDAGANVRAVVGVY